MTDVLSMANDRREELTKELATIDDFIRMGQSLLADRSGSQPDDSDAPPLVLGFGKASGVRLAGGNG